MNKKEIKINKKIIYWTIGILIFLVWFFWPMNYSYFIFESDSGERFDGEVYFDGVLIGSTENGEIKVNYEEAERREEIKFVGTYEGEEYEFFYDFPQDYEEYYELPFQVERDEILEQIEKNHDDFPNISELHWGKIPITYKFEEPSIDRQTSTERQINLTRDAFSKIEEETSRVVRFEEVTEDPMISIYFKPNNYDSFSSTHTVADALISEVDDSRNLILKGEISFYGQGFVCDTGYPALEVHEILHLFDIPHNPLVNSVMSPYTAESSSKCKVTKIDKEYISCLRHIYSNGNIQGDCEFPNVIHESNLEYGCEEGLYPDKDNEYCCPEPDMIIDEEGYCSY